MVFFCSLQLNAAVGALFLNKTTDQEESRYTVFDDDDSKGMYDAVLCFFLSFFATNIVYTCVPFMFSTAQSYSSETLEHTERKKERANSVGIKESMYSIITKRSSSRNPSAVTPLIADSQHVCGMSKIQSCLEAIDIV